MFSSIRSRRLIATALLAGSTIAGSLALQPTSAVAQAPAPSPAAAVAGEAAGATNSPTVVSATGQTLRAVPITESSAVQGSPGRPGAPLVNQKVRLTIPGGPSGERVIGVDNRTLVNPTTATDATRQTVLIYSHGSDGWCTGFMISPDTVATAGHCVFHNKVGRKGWWDMSKMGVYPAYNGITGTAPYGGCGVRNLYTNRNWTLTANNWDWDYGVIKLNCTIGNTVGWYGYTNSGYSTSTVLSTQGYPSDKPATSMWRTTGRVLSAYGTAQWLSDIDIMAGQSGSPVYRTDAGCNRCAVAIVSWEPTSGPIKANGLNRINPNSMALFNQVRAI